LFRFNQFDLWKQKSPGCLSGRPGLFRFKRMKLRSPWRGQLPASLLRGATCAKPLLGGDCGGELGLSELHCNSFFNAGTQPTSIICIG
jgi:hypothetical protein